MHLLVYLGLFFGMIVEGTGVVFTAAFLITQAQYNPLAIIITVLLGAFLEELFFYGLGRWFRKWERVKTWTDRLSQPLHRHLVLYTYRTLLISKFVYGIHRAVLVTAGTMHIPLKKFVKDAFSSTAIWLVGMGLLAYSLSSSYGILMKEIKYVELAFAVPLVLMFVIQYFVSRKLRKEL